MKHNNNNYNYPEIITYYEDMNEEHDFDEHIESLKNDVYSKQLTLEIIDSLQDEEMLSDFSTKLIKEMFEYYINHKHEHEGEV